MRLRLALAAALLASPAVAFDATGIPEADAVLRAFETETESVTGVGAVAWDGPDLILRDVVTEYTLDGEEGSSVTRLIKLSAPTLTAEGLTSPRVEFGDSRYGAGPLYMESAKSLGHDVILRPGNLAITAPGADLLSAFGELQNNGFLIQAPDVALRADVFTQTAVDRLGDGVLSGAITIEDVSLEVGDTIEGSPVPDVDLDVGMADISIDYRWTEDGALEFKRATFSIDEFVDISLTARVTGVTLDLETGAAPTPGSPTPATDVYVQEAVLTVTNTGMGDALSQMLASSWQIDRDVSRMMAQQIMAGALLAIPDAELRASLSLGLAALLAAEKASVVVALMPETPFVLGALESVLDGEFSGLPALGLAITVDP